MLFAIALSWINCEYMELKFFVTLRLLVRFLRFGKFQKYLTVINKRGRMYLLVKT